MNLSHNLSRYHLTNHVQRTVNQCYWSSSLLLFNSQLYLLSTELHRHTLSSQAMLLLDTGPGSNAHPSAESSKAKQYKVLKALL